MRSDLELSSCRPFDALTNLEVLKRSDNHANGAHLKHFFNVQQS
jgi:hypothetical protein